LLGLGVRFRFFRHLVFRGASRGNPRENFNVPDRNVPDSTTATQRIDMSDDMRDGVRREFVTRAATKSDIFQDIFTSLDTARTRSRAV
jgi:hypothetical protein